MKKAILTIGLFTLVMASTSFASPKNSTASIIDNTATASIGRNGNQDTGGKRKLDLNHSEKARTSTDIFGAGGNGNQDTGGKRKTD